MMRNRIAFILSLILVGAVGASARRDTRDHKKRDFQVERTTPADSNVKVVVCIGSGNITVNGWNRKEVRVRTDDEGLAFQRTGAVSESDPAKEITVLSGAGRRHESSCMSDSDFAIDVPLGANIQLTSRDGDISVANVGRAQAHTQGGSVQVDHATQGVEVATIGGDISVKNSKGAMKLTTVGGEISARASGPNLTTDGCEVNTVGGDITLEQITHGLINAHTVSGSVKMSGPLQHGGHYSMQSLSGDLSLEIPSDSSFRLSASITGGVDIDSDFELKMTSTESSEKIGKHPMNLKQLEAVHGSGDAMISLSSFSGNVRLKKK